MSLSKLSVKLELCIYTASQNRDVRRGFQRPGISGRKTSKLRRYCTSGGCLLNVYTLTQTHTHKRTHAIVYPMPQVHTQLLLCLPRDVFFPPAAYGERKLFFFPLPRYISFSYLCCLVESLAHLQTALRSCCSTPFRWNGSSATILGLGYTIRLLEGENDECFVKFWKFPTSLLPFKSCKRWETNVHPAAIACNSYRSIYKHKDEGIWGLNKIAGSLMVIIYSR